MADERQAAMAELARRELARRQQTQAPADVSAPTLPQGGTVADTLGQGLSFGFSDEIAGVAGAAVNSLANIFGKGTGDSFGEAYTGIRDAARYNKDAFSERNPGTALASEIGGGLLTGGLGAAKAGAFSAAKNAPTLLGRLAPTVQTGVVQGGLYGAGASEGGSAREVAQDAIKGSAIGGLSAGVLGTIGSGARNTANRVFQTQSTNPMFQRQVQLLKDKVGIKSLTTGQTTGSPSIRSAETTVSETMFGARIGRQLAKNREQLQGKLMEMSGFAKKDVQRGMLDADAVERAAKKFSRRYNSLLRGKSVRLDGDEFLDQIAKVEADNLSMLPFQQKKEVKDIISQFLDEAVQGPTSAEKYQKIRSDLAKRQKNSVNTPYISELYKGLKNALDDEFARATGKGRLKSQVDREYSRFAKLRDTFEGSGAIQTSRGEIPLSSLLRKSAKTNDRDFNELVRAGQSVLGDPTPNSATASRLANLLFLGQGGASAATGGLDAGLLSIGLPIGTSQALSRGVTGSNVASGAGMLASPVINPLLLDRE